jgi:hypothetical protein
MMTIQFKGAMPNAQRERLGRVFLKHFAAETYPMSGKNLELETDSREQASVTQYQSRPCVTALR